MPLNATATEGESNKEKILDAAIDEFSDHGFAGARVESIAKSAGLNVRLVYHYFGGKEGLYDAAIASVMEQMARLVKGVPVIRMSLDEESLRDVFGRMFQLTLSKPRQMKLLVSEILSGGERLFKLNEKMPELFHPVFSRAVELFQSLLGADHVPSDDDAIVLLSLAGMTSFLAAGYNVTQLFLGGDLTSKKKWEAAIFNLMLRGIKRTGK